MVDSLAILGLTRSDNERESIISYRKLARKYYPYKNYVIITGISAIEATSHFQTFNNAFSFVH